MNNRERIILAFSIVLLLYLVPVAKADIALGTVATATSTNQVTLTTTASDQILIVQLYINDGTASSGVSDVTDGAFSLANAAGSTADPPRVETWYYNGPSVGSKTITATNAGGNFIMGAFGLQNTRATSPIGVVAANTGATIGISNTIVTNYNMSWIVSVAGAQRDNTMTEDGTQTSIWTLTTGGGDKKVAEGTYELKNPAGSDTQAWTMNRADPWAISSVEIRAAMTPYWNNNFSYPTSPVVYSTPQDYQFNVSWFFDGDKDQVWIEHNFTQSLDNYTNIGNIGNVYSYNYSNLAAGYYVWRMHANATSGLKNQTDWFIYQVLKANSSTNLTLNDLAANLSVESGDYVNITAYKLLGEGNLYLYNNGTLINQGSSSTLNNYTRFITPGLYNITASYQETQNYSANQSTRWITVTDTTAPIATINSISPNPAQYGSQNVIVNWGFTELNIDTYYVNISYPNGTFLGQYYTNVTLNHTTNLSALGNYNVTVFANDTSGNSDVTSQLFLVRDTLAPASSNLEETPPEPVTYTPAQGYEFNITWTDLHGVVYVELVFDGVTYTDHVNTSGEFSKTFPTLSAGQHNYTWFANDSSNNQGSSGLQTYTIDKANSQVNLSINGISNNITINEGANAEINASLLIPTSGIIELYRDGSLVQSGSNQLSNNTVWPAGYYNFTSRYSGNNNYTTDSLSYFLRVNALPVVTLVSPPDLHTDVDGNFTLTCEATDTEGLQSITLYHNFTQAFGANETIPVSGTYASIDFNLTNIPDGTYLWNCLANDTYNATDFDINRTIIINSSADQPPTPVREYPPPNYVTNSQNINFNCSATDPEGLQNISLWWNVGGSFHRNETVNVSGSTNSTIFSKTNIPEGSWFWACEAGDPLGQFSITGNRSFLVDLTKPSISLSLLSNQTNVTNSFAYFNFTPYDNYDTNIACNLTIDSVTENSSTIVNGSLFSTTVYGIADGTHNYNVTCVDNANNFNTSETRTFYVYTIGYPENISIFLFDDNESVVINWSSLGKATSYNLYITNNYTQGFSSIPNITGISNSNYTDTNANTSLARYYRVAAVNGAAENLSNVTAGKIGKQAINTGFHLLSFPFNKTYVLNNGTNNGFTLNTYPFDCVESIFRWNGSLFEQTVNEGSQTFLPAIGSESFTELSPLRSYWLSTNTSCYITYLGIVPTQQIEVSMNDPFYLAGWYSVHEVVLGDEGIVGNPLPVSPTNSLTNIYRYNSSSGLFEGTTHFSGYGWWPSYASQQFTTLGPTIGYYFGVNPVSNWTHDPEYTS